MTGNDLCRRAVARFAAIAAVGLAGGCADGSVEAGRQAAAEDATRLLQAFRASPGDWQATCYGPVSAAVHAPAGQAYVSVAALAERRRVDKLAVVYCLAVGSNAEARRAPVTNDLLLAQLSDGVPIAVTALSAVDIDHWTETDAMLIPGGYINYRNSPESVRGQSAPVTMPGSEFLYLSVPDDPAVPDHQRLPCALLAHDFAQARRLLAAKKDASPSSGMTIAAQLGIEAIITTRGDMTQAAAYLATPRDIRAALFAHAQSAQLEKDHNYVDEGAWERAATAGAMAAPTLDRQNIQTCKAFEPAKLADFPLPAGVYDVTEGGMDKLNKVVSE